MRPTKPLLIATACVALSACLFDWGSLDPRESGSGGAAGGTLIGGGGLGAGGEGATGTGTQAGTGGQGGDGGQEPLCDLDNCPVPEGICEVAICVGTACGVGVAPDGTPCPGDGVFCNGEEICMSGGCTSPGDPCPVADGDDDCSEACDESSQSCTAAEPKDTPCDDGLYCNGIDACNPQGSCTQHENAPCPPVSDADCAEACDEDNDNCSLPEPDGSPCSDGMYCNGTDSCSGGSCTNHSGNPCPGADGDTDCSESCNEAADSCTANDPNGTECNGIVDSICCSAGVCITNNGC